MSALATVEKGDLLPVSVIKDRLDQVMDLMRSAMVESVDYGVIPGTTKPTLLKPGAEKLARMFQFDIQPETVKTFSPDGHLTVETRCTLYHSPTENRLGSASAICSTREAKYAYRNSARKCPACGAEAIIKGKEEFGGGWLCWKKKGGCNAKFHEDDSAIVNQPTGRVPNEDLADSYNTVLRIAEKRAFIAAVRLVTGCSAIFDEEQPHVEIDPEEHRPAPRPAAKADPKPASKQAEPAPQDDRVMGLASMALDIKTRDDLKRYKTSIAAANRNHEFSAQDWDYLTELGKKALAAIEEYEAAAVG